MSDALARTSGGGWLVAPANMAEAFKFAETIAASDLAPKDFRMKPANVLVAIQLGAEVGLSPMQALQNIAVVNGRPTIWGDAQLALVRAHPSVLGYSEVWDRQTRTWTCTLKRKARDGSIETTVGEFSFADAQRAKLASKQGPWTEYPDRMIKMRARSWCLRDGAADILKGLAQREEAEDIEPVVVPEAPRTALPARSSEPEKPALPPSPPAAAPANTQAPASRPLPTKTAKNYPVRECADRPFTELSDGELGRYLAYYTEKLPTLTQPNHVAAVEATIEAAEREMTRRIAEEGDKIPDDESEPEVLDDPSDHPEPSGDLIEYTDPETGEIRTVPADSLEGQLALSLAAKGTDRTDTNPAWGMDDGMPTKAKASRTARKAVQP